MNNNINNDSVDIIEILKSIYSEKYLVIVLISIFSITGLSLSLLITPTYKSTAVITPIISNSNIVSNSNLSGLAAMAGINLEKVTNEDGNISPLLYPEIFYSLPFMLEVSDVKLKFSNYDEKLTYHEYIFESSYFNPFQYLRNKISKIFSPKSQNIKINDLISVNNEKFNIIKSLKKDLTLDLNSKEGSIYISASLPDPYASAQLAQLAQNLFQQYVIKFKIQKVNDELRYIEERLKENESNFKSIQEKIADYKDKNQNFSTEVAKIELKFLESEYDLAFKIYSELASNYESKKLQVKENTPVFTTLSPAVVPNEKSNLSKLSILIISFLLGSAFSFFLYIK